MEAETDLLLKLQAAADRQDRIAAEQATEREKLRAAARTDDRLLMAARLMVALLATGGTDPRPLAKAAIDLAAEELEKRTA